MLISDYTMAAKVAEDMGLSVDGVLIDPACDWGAYVICFDPAKLVESAYSTHWINLVTCNAYNGRYDMNVREAGKDLLERAGYGQA